MKKQKTILACLLAILLLFGMSACGEKSETKEKKKSADSEPTEFAVNEYTYSSEAKQAAESYAKELLSKKGYIKCSQLSLNQTKVRRCNPTIKVAVGAYEYTYAGSVYAYDEYDSLDVMKLDIAITVNIREDGTCSIDTEGSATPKF